MQHFYLLKPGGKPWQTVGLLCRNLVDVLLHGLKAQPDDQVVLAPHSLWRRTCQHVVAGCLYFWNGHLLRPGIIQGQVKGRVEGWFIYNLHHTI